MNNVALELIDIEKSYLRGEPNETKVLSNVNLRIATGETVALVAPSGAGKSTLLHIAGLLDVADSGDVRIGDVALSDLSDARRTQARRQELGFVYQFHHLLPEFNALENIVLPQLADGASRKAAEARAIELLDHVGLSQRASQRPNALSGGEAQRVAVCRALANAPRLLLADEPTGNLDPATSDTVFDALVSIVKDTGMSALIATHNMALAERMDRRIKLEQGQIKEA